MTRIKHKKIRFEWEKSLPLSRDKHIAIGVRDRSDHWKPGISQWKLTNVRPYLGSLAGKPTVK